MKTLAQYTVAFFENKTDTEEQLRLDFETLLEVKQNFYYFKLYNEKKSGCIFFVFIQHVSLYMVFM